MRVEDCRYLATFKMTVTWKRKLQVATRLWRCARARRTYMRVPAWHDSRTRLPLEALIFAKMRQVYISQVEQLYHRKSVIITHVGTIFSENGSIPLAISEMNGSTYSLR